MAERAEEPDVYRKIFWPREKSLSSVVKKKSGISSVYVCKPLSTHLSYEPQFVLLETVCGSSHLQELCGGSCEGF